MSNRLPPLTWIALASGRPSGCLGRLFGLALAWGIFLVLVYMASILLHN